MELVQQFPRGEQGLKLQAAVEEVRLVCDAVGGSLQEMRDPAYRASPDLVQRPDRGIQIVFSVAHVGAEGNVGGVPAALDLHAYGF